MIQEEKCKRNIDSESGCKRNSDSEQGNVKETVIHGEEM